MVLRTSSTSNIVLLSMAVFGMHKKQKKTCNICYIASDPPPVLLLVLAVHLVNLLGWMGQGDHSKTFFSISTLLLEHSFMVKSFGWWVAHVIIVSAPVQIIGIFGFFGLGLNLRSGFGACWDWGLGTWTQT